MSRTKQQGYMEGQAGETGFCQFVTTLPVGECGQVDAETHVKGRSDQFEVSGSRIHVASSNFDSRRCRPVSRAARGARALLVFPIAPSSPSRATSTSCRETGSATRTFDHRQTRAHARAHAPQLTACRNGVACSRMCRLY